MPYADYLDFTARYHTSTKPEQESYITTLLEDASNILDIRVPSLATRVVTNDALSNIARYVAVSMVRRVLDNPDNVTQQSVGPFSITRSQVNGLSVRDDEITLLAEPLSASNYVGVAWATGWER